jgi:hypothetical protein
MKARNKLSVGLVGILGAGLVGGGLLAAALANVSAGGFAVGQAELSATCLTPATAAVNFDTIPNYLDGDWRVESVQVTVADGTNPIACDAIPVKVTAYDINGDALQVVSTTISQSGAGIDQVFAFAPYLTAADIVGYGVSITG